MFTVVFAAIKNIPELGTLIFGVPSSEIIAVGEEALFGSGFFFVTPTTTKCGIKLVILNAIEKGHSLKSIPASVNTFFFGDTTLIN